MTGGVFGDPNPDAWWDDECPDELPPLRIVTVELPPFDEDPDVQVYRQGES